MKSSYSINEEKAARLLEDAHSSSSESGPDFSKRSRQPLLATTTTIFGRVFPQRTKILIATYAMLVGLFFERLCFLSLGYSLAVREQAYAAVLLNALVSSIFTFLNQYVKKQKHKRRLHELFFIRRTPRLNYFIVIFVSLLDLIYSVMLFFGLYKLPLAFFLVGLQFSIGIMTFLRRCAFKYESRPVHYFCALALILTEILVFISLGLQIQDDDVFGGSLLFLLSSIPLLLSQLIKESLIRTQPLHRNLLNFKIALFQLILAILLTPFAIAILGEENRLPSFGTMANFYQRTFSCLFSFSSRKHPECDFCIFEFIGYNAALIVYQLALSSLLLRSSMKRVKLIQASGFIVTMIALGFATLVASQLSWEFTALQTVATLICFASVSIFNLVPDQAEQVRIEGKLQ